MNLTSINTHYRKKPVVIEAIQLRWTTWSALCDFTGGLINRENPGMYCNDPSDFCGEEGPYIQVAIPTLEGHMIAKHGDWIIKGVKGEFYPVKDEIFRLTYEAVE